MKSRLGVVIVASAVALLFNGAVVTSAMASSNSAVRSGSTVRLTSDGATEWNFEALLRETFGSAPICSLSSKPGSPVNFPKNDHGCSPLARYSPWIFDFKDLGQSSFHVMSKEYTQKGWVTNAAPVLIEGDLVACNKSDTQVLMGYSDEPSDAIECAVNPYIHG
jgi:hypothetical protein